jgi:putative Ca2+/H+ antiporter (TMEM165/GDT1 family)
MDVVKDVFIGEIGDKTMMVTLGLVEVLALSWVLVGIAPSCFFVPAVGVLIGIGLKGIIPLWLINYACALLFIGLVVWSIKEAQERDDEEEEEESSWAILRWISAVVDRLKIWAKASGPGTAALAFAMFSVAEMADRTQVITITKTVEGSKWDMDLIASGVGLLLANLVAVVIFFTARQLLKRRFLMYGAAVLFAVSAVRIVAETAFHYNVGWYWWLSSAVVLAVVTYPWAAKFFDFPTGPEKPKQIYA